MGLTWAFSKATDIKRLMHWIDVFGLTYFQSWGFYIGNTFVGIVRARK